MLRYSSNRPLCLVGLVCHHLTCRGGAQGFREAVSGASSELFTAEEKEAESAVVKKLKQPKKTKKKNQGKKKGGDDVELSLIHI